MNLKNGLYVVIPALNEEKTIRSIIIKLKTISEKVIVVDDGSTDRTGSLALEAGAHVVTHPVPQGYDSSVADGLNEAFKLGAQAAITCDADGQHQIVDVQRVAEPVLAGEVQYCSGVRTSYNRAIERIIGFFAKFILGTKDPFCGLKCYHKQIFQRFGPFPRKLFVGTLPFVWLAGQKSETRFISIETSMRLDKPRFGTTLKASYKLMKAFYQSLFALFLKRTRRGET